MKIKHILLFSLAAVLLAGCINKDKILPTVTGTSYEVLVVMNNGAWQSAAGDTVRKYLEADMPCLPQIEPVFNVSRTPWGEFSDILKPVRNIMLADIDGNKYTQVKIKYLRDRWAHPQAVVHIQAPTAQDFAEAYSQAGRDITNFFVNSELERQYDFYKRHFTNSAAYKRLKSKFGIDMHIPNDITASTDTTNFYWITDTKGRVRRDIMVYTYPYTSTDDLTLESLMHKRDSICRLYIHGRDDSSYVATEWHHIPPILTPITVDSAYCAEVRGLWRMEHGDSMGGPFVMNARITPDGKRILVAEGFCYGPGQKKRNPLRQLEAVIRGIKFDAQ